MEHHDRDETQGVVSSWETEQWAEGTLIFYQAS